LVGQHAQERWPDIDAPSIEIDQAFEADKVGEIHHVCAISDDIILRRTR
jgi:hypothetical protein